MPPSAGDTLTIPQAMELATGHHATGQLAEAEKIYRLILQAEPNHPQALHLLGMLAHQVGQNQQAVGLLTQATRLNPNDPGMVCDLGTVLGALGQPDAACTAFQRSLAIQPDNAIAHYNLGNLHHRSGQLDEAAAAFQQTIAIQPDLVEAHTNLGNVLRDQGQLEASRRAYQQAIAIRPDYFEAHSNLGNVLRDLGLLDASITAYRQALTIQPDVAEIHNNLGNSMTGIARLDEAANCYQKALEIDPNMAVAHSNLLITLPFMSEVDCTAILQAARRFGAQFSSDSANQSHHQPSHHHQQQADLHPERRLRIGYVAPSLHKHVLVDNIEPLLTAHNRDRVSVHLYAHVPYPGEITWKLKEMVDGWTFIQNLSDDQVAQCIVEDRIDILVEVMGHWSDNRLLVFTRKPAPIQVSYLCQGLTTGLAEMDYAIGDRWVNEDGAMQNFAVEQVVELEHAFQCVLYRESQQVPINPSPPCEYNGHITFGTLANQAKISTKSLALWASVLKSIPSARLLIKGMWLKQQAQRQRMLKRLARHGIAETRVDLLDHVPETEYLGLYNQVDIILDTFPFTGGRTTTDALWMGVPVVTLVGACVSGRLSYDSLAWIGATELVARSETEFVKIATELAEKPEQLRRYRQQLRPALQHAPLLDARLHVKELEGAYRWMWMQWLEKHKS
ncbi:MAG: tetratricopeptide repeat protein [Magnetococcales bacterium]|nr:tetratricopeptide repeat protein [Magnetococcales bacterium]